MTLGALPSHAPETLRLIGHLVDDIWHLAGDKTTDLNWYSRRAGLAAIYASTEVYMLTDKTDDFRDTWDFLQRRFDDAEATADVPKQVERFVMDTVSQAGRGLAGVVSSFPFSSSSSSSSKRD